MKHQNQCRFGASQAVESEIAHLANALNHLVNIRCIIKGKGRYAQFHLHWHCGWASYHPTKSDIKLEISEQRDAHDAFRQVMH